MDTESFDPYHRWLGIPPQEQPPDHYRLLSVQQFESDPAVIENGADKQMAHLRMFQAGKHGELSQRLLNEVAAARVTLLNAEKKAAYDVSLREQLAEETVPETPAEKSLPFDLGLPQEPAALSGLPAEGNPVLRTRRSGPSPGVLAAGAVAAVVLFGVLVWVITGRGRVDAEVPPIAIGDPQEPVASPPRAPAPKLPRPEHRNELSPAPTATTEPPQLPEPPQPPPELAAPPQIAPFDADQAGQHQQAWADFLGLPVEWENSIGMKFVLIPPGEFMMGSPEEEVEQRRQTATSRGEPQSYIDQLRAEAPQHRARITRPFYLGIYEVTQAEYESVMGNNPSGFSPEGKGAAKVAGLDTGRHPVDSVTWNEASAFCEKLSSLPEEQAAGRVYMLPTEAQWEYACRAGTTTQWSCGDDEQSLVDHGWVSANAAGKTYRVGTRLPNGFGLFDMHGNVWEWCADRFDEGYYAVSPVDDPPGPESGSIRVLRGGSWGHGAVGSRSARRHPFGAGARFHTVGFRLVFDVPGVQAVPGSVAEARETPPTVRPETQPAREVAQADRKPVPSSAEQQEIGRAIDDLYDTADSRKPDEALEMAGKLAALAERARDATERFVLLRRAAELASEGGDARRMLELLDRLVEEFEVDRVLVQCLMLNAFAKRASGETQIGALVDASAGVIGEALAAERFDLADSLSAAVYQACVPSAGRPFRVEALARRREVQELQKRWEEVQTALTALEANADDQAAHALVGEWYWLVRGDWDRAMPHLAKGRDAELKRLADREFSSPPEDPAGQVELADAWWELAQAPGLEPKRKILARAKYWYEKALPGVDGPLVKAKVQKRLKELSAP